MYPRGTSYCPFSCVLTVCVCFCSSCWHCKLMTTWPIWRLMPTSCRLKVSIKRLRLRKKERDSVRKEKRKKEKEKEKEKENKSNRVRTTDSFWLTARVIVFESSSKWHTFLFLMLFCSNSAHFSEIQLVCDGPTDGRTDGWTDGPTDGRTDKVGFRVACTRLKSF